MAGPLIRDRVRQKTLTTGEGDVTLFGTVMGFRDFGTIGDGNSCYYVIAHESAHEFEIGIGTYTASGTKLSRDTVLISTNGNVLVSFSAGQKDVYVVCPAVRLALLVEAQTANCVLAGPSSGGTAQPAYRALVQADLPDLGGVMDFELLATATPSNAATVDFTLTGWTNSAYMGYLVVISHIAPATDGASLYMRTSSDGGSSFDSGAGNYSWGITGLNDAGGAAVTGSSGDTQISMATGLGADTNECSSGNVWLFQPSAAKYAHMNWDLNIGDNGGTLSKFFGSGRRIAAADVDAIRFLMSSGNIASGELRLYGMRAA